tara:strand:+ start:4825 stop:5820 length:996 start_codon:yes stop_codon:yes gene_type:complete
LEKPKEPVELFFHNCPCQSLPQEHNFTSVDYQEVIRRFEVIRGQCLALKEVLAPNEVWDDFRTVVLESDEDMLHQHILLVAYRQGGLSQITTPVHRYLINSGRSRIRLNKKHLKDIREAWALQDLGVKRRQKTRAFWGRLTELHVTEWIEKMGWRITNLEAWGGKLDIECASPTRIECAIEVKSIVSEDADYLADVSHPDWRDASGTVSPYQASNLVLLRGLEAADKLRYCEKVRIACLVVSEDMWHRFEPFLRESWSLWDEPRFIEIRPKLQYAIQRNKRIDPENRDELKRLIEHLNAIWIVKKSPCFELSSHSVFAFTDPPSPSPLCKN